MPFLHAGESNSRRQFHRRQARALHGRLVGIWEAQAWWLVWEVRSRQFSSLTSKTRSAVMLTPVSPESVAEEMIPQAIIERPTSYFEKSLETRFVKGHDDLDEYEVAAFRLDSQGLVFELKHYPGYPNNTTTLYLPERIKTVETITYLIAVIANEMRVPREWIIWQRADNPQL